MHLCKYLINSQNERSREVLVIYHIFVFIT